MTAKSFDDTNGNGITRDNDLDTSVSSSTIGGGPTLGIASAIRYQGTNAFGRRVNTASTDFGFFLNTGTARDTTTATYRTFMWKGWISDYGNLNNGLQGGLSCRMGSTTAAYHRWTAGDDGTVESDGFVYPAAGGWVLKPIDATLRAWLESTSGNPDETAIDEIGFTASISATSNGENLWGDALDWVETGFHVVGGDSTDPDVTFLDFVDQDEGSASTNFDRVALWRTVEGAIYWFGTNVIGRTFGGVTTTATEFTDSFRTLICPGGFVREGFNTLDFDISNASSVMTLNNITVIGRGRSGIKLWFDAGDILAINQPGDVDETADTISYLSHGLKTGDQILYSREGNTNYVTGAAGNGESQLVTGTTGEYYYAIRVDDDTFAVASSITNAVAGTRLALSGQTNEIHSFTRTPDTRFDFTQTGTSGTLTLNSCNLTSARNITLDTNATINTTNLIECGKLFLNGATLDGCSISSPTVPIGEGFIECTGPQLQNIDDCSFTSATDSQRGPGHAIEVTSATGSASYTFTGNTFTDYASYSGTDHPVESIDTGLNRFTITSHPYTSGEAVYYDANGNTPITGLTDGAVYYVESVDANTIELWGSKDAVGGGTGEISISGTISGSGHRFDSVNAAIWNNSGQSWTLSVTGGGTSPSVRNTGAVEVTIANNVSVTLTGLKTSGPNGEAATTEVRVYRDSDNVELAGIESSGATFNFSVASGTAINIVIHNLYYIYQRIALTPTADIPELPIQQVVDRNYDPV